MLELPENTVWGVIDVPSVENKTTSKCIVQYFVYEPYTIDRRTIGFEAEAFIGSITRTKNFMINCVDRVMSLFVGVWPGA